MLNQELLYQYIYQEQWKEILDLLYKYRRDIANDSMLAHAGQIFEQAFFAKIRDHAETAEISEYLDTLYTLHHGNFYKLSDDNYRSLILELVTRKPSTEAVNYAGAFPDEPICKAVIEKATSLNAKKKQINQMPINWIEIFNRLFELINNQNDTATYFSGPKFINVVRETEPYFPDYTQYIDQRNQEGKSTSRKIFFYDILTGLSEISRKSVMIRLLTLLRPFKGPQVDQIERLLGMQPSIAGSTKAPAATASKHSININPKVFISYSWDDEHHKTWVLQLANKLRSNGVDVILDRYYLTAGKSITHFVENAFNDADKVVIVFTPNYKLKADHRSGGVGYEYSIMNNSLYQNQTGNDKVIPVLRTGSLTESIPDFMQQYIHLDLRNDATFENSYTDLLREIYNEPAIKIPEIGQRPNF